MLLLMQLMALLQISAQGDVGLGGALRDVGPGWSTSLIATRIQDATGLQYFCLRKQIEG